MNNKIIQLLFCLLIVLATACTKNETPLPDNSISIQGFSTKDTLVTPLPVKRDSLFVMGLTSKLSGVTSSVDHWVSFSVDSTKIDAYRAKYGDAILLPSQSYFFYKSTCKIAANTTLSDSVQINIIKEINLKGYSTYVLPITIKSVDGKTENSIGNQTLYLVFKTGKPAFILRDGWTIQSVSSYYSTFLSTKAIDADDANTYWTTALTSPMPQWIVINFNSSQTFSAVNYFVPPLLKYPTLGGYPTSIQIETSMDGTTWVNKGIFASNIVNNTQTLNVGLTTAKYLRFTSLASVKYSNTYTAIFISGIGLIP
jgi:hypothetical protein